MCDYEWVLCLILFLLGEIGDILLGKQLFKMRFTLIIITIIFFANCKNKISHEYSEVIETYPSGSVKKEFVYQDTINRKHYTINEYFESGKISFKATVYDVWFERVKISYYPNGNLLEVDSLRHPCPLEMCCCDGKVLKYYSNGKLDQTFEQTSGLANGLVHIYDNDSSGKLAAVYTYKYDKREGPFQQFYDDGKLYKQGTYRNNLLADQLYYFEPNGDTMKIVSTWKGKEDFPAKKWLSNGQIFYAEYISNDYQKALYRWKDRTGKEIKRQIVSAKKGGEWITKEGKWITPN